MKLDSEETLFLQRLLKSQGIYDGKLDGKWGSKTEMAVVSAESRAAALRSEIGGFDPRTERAISTLHLAAQAKARELLVLAAAAGFHAKIISATRTYAEQNALYRQGRFGNKAARVTNARGGQSNHNFGIAWDIGLFSQSGVYLDGDVPGEIAEYRRLGEYVRPLGLEWGGNWKSIVDFPHYQLATGRSTVEIRKLFEEGLPYI